MFKQALVPLRFTGRPLGLPLEGFLATFAKDPFHNLLRIKGFPFARRLGQPLTPGPGHGSLR